MTTPATNDTVGRIITEYGAILAEPAWERRKSKLKALRNYAAQVTGKERKILLTYFPDIFTNIN